MSVKIARQLFFAFVYSRIQYGIEIYGNCAKETLSKLQVMQNKLLKLLLKYDRSTPTNFLQHVLSILQLNDMHIVKVLLFVNECRSGRIPDIFLDYYKVRETEHKLRNNRTLDIPWARTDLGQNCCDIKGARLWNMFFDTVNPLLHRKSFCKRIIKYFVSTYIWLIRPHCVSSFIISTATENICMEQMCICTIYKMYTSYCHFLMRCIVHSANSSIWMTRCYVSSVQSVARLLLL